MVFALLTESGYAEQKFLAGLFALLLLVKYQSTRMLILTKTQVIRSYYCLAHEDADYCMLEIHLLIDYLYLSFSRLDSIILASKAGRIFYCLLLNLVIGGFFL